MLVHLDPKFEGEGHGLSSRSMIRNLLLAIFLLHFSVMWKTELTTYQLLAQTMHFRIIWFHDKDISKFSSVYCWNCADMVYIILLFLVSSILFCLSFVGNWKCCMLCANVLVSTQKHTRLLSFAHVVHRPVYIHQVPPNWTDAKIQISLNKI